MRCDERDRASLSWRRNGEKKTNDIILSAVQWSASSLSKNVLDSVSVSGVTVRLDIHVHDCTYLMVRLSM